MTTTKSLTFQQIRSVKLGAQREHNYELAVICDLALEGEIDLDDYSVLSPAEERRIRKMDREQAYAVIVDTINGAS
jgi:hypothetical protein